MGAFLDEIQAQALSMHYEAAGARACLTLPEPEFARLVEEMGEDLFHIDEPQTVTWVGIADVLVKPFPPRAGEQEPAHWRPKEREIAQ